MTRCDGHAMCDRTMEAHATVARNLMAMEARAARQVMAIRAAGTVAKWAAFATLLHLLTRRSWPS